MASTLGSTLAVGFVSVALGCARPVTAPAGSVAVAPPADAKLASAPGSAAAPPTPQNRGGTLAEARLWLLDANGTFPTAIQRGGSWLISLIAGTSADSAGNELALNLRALQLQGRTPTAEELATLPGWVSPPRTVWVLSEDRPPCQAEVDPNPRVDFYDHGTAAMEVAHAIRGCETQGALDLAFSNATPDAALRHQPARVLYERENDADLTRPWNHPLARFLVAAPEHRPTGGEYGPGRQSIRLLGVDSEPPLLDLLTGIVWNHTPQNEDDYDACKASVVTRHELGVLEGEAWTALPVESVREAHLKGAVVAGKRLEAVIGVSGTRAVFLPVAPEAPSAAWTVLETGVHHDAAAAFADRQLGPYCGP